MLRLYTIERLVNGVINTLETLHSNRFYSEYLSSKKTVDDRALNKDVLSALRNRIKEYNYIKVLEIGSGTGNMIIRLLENDILGASEYVAVDINKEFLNESKERIKIWAAGESVLFDESEQLSLKNKDIRFSFYDSEVLDFISKSGPGQFDLIIANAFLDLVCIHDILPMLFRLLRNNGLFYFSINYDGRTDLLPVLDNELDEWIFELYHNSMDERLVNGKKCCSRYSGRMLLEEILKNGGQIIEAGSSDWVIAPFRGKYRNKEDYFLDFIISTIYNALKNESMLPKSLFENWIRKRHEQVQKGELILITHQLDFLGEIVSE